MAHRKHIHENCRPEELYYDDDTGEGSDELKKVTIQAKERIDELVDLWKLKFGDPEENREVRVDRGFFVIYPQSFIYLFDFMVLLVTWLFYLPAEAC